MWRLFAPVITWVLRTLVVRFLVLTVVFTVVGFIVPYAVQYLINHINVTPLTNAFARLPAGVWFFLDYFEVPFGAPLVISAMISRFLIRRLPVIG